MKEQYKLKIVIDYEAAKARAQRAVELLGHLKILSLKLENNRTDEERSQDRSASQLFSRNLSKLIRGGILQNTLDKLPSEN